MVSLLVQSERLGTDAAPALHELSTTFRTTMRQRAEAQANRTSFYLLFPTVLCLLMAVGIVLLGPQLLQFMREWDQLMNTVNNSNSHIEQSNRIFREPNPFGPRPPTAPPAPAQPGQAPP